MARRLRYLRQFVHEENSISDYAERLGITIPRYSNFENGFPLSLEVAHAIVDITPGLTLDWLYYERLEGLPLQLAKTLMLAGQTPPQKR